VKTPGTGGLGYFSLSKAKTLSVNDATESDETLGGRFFGIAALVLVSVVTCTAHGTVVPARTLRLSWVNVFTIPSGPSSVSLRLSREFRLWNVRNQEDRNGIMNKDDVHGHERAEIEPNHDEEGWRV
jgi:hypothetical protein